MGSDHPKAGLKKPPMINFRGKNRRFYAASAVMLTLILAPFGLYAALTAGNDVLAGILFATMTGCMVYILVMN